MVPDRLTEMFYGALNCAPYGIDSIQHVTHFEQLHWFRIRIELQTKACRDHLKLIIKP